MLFTIRENPRLGSWTWINYMAILQDHGEGDLGGGNDAAFANKAGRFNGRRCVSQLGVHQSQ
jgi:hypothetical protein